MLWIGAEAGFNFVCFEIKRIFTSFRSATGYVGRRGKKESGQLFLICVRRERDDRPFRRKYVHRDITRRGKIGIRQKRMKISMRCVAMEQQKRVRMVNGWWRWKGRGGKRPLSRLGISLWGESRIPRGSRAGQCMGPCWCGRGSSKSPTPYLGSNSLATRLALLHSSPSMKASIASRMRSMLR